jgi:hypothetical protein
MGRIEYFRIISIAGALLAGSWLPIRWIGFHLAPELETFFDVCISVISIVNLYLYFHDTKTNARDWKSWLLPAVVLDLFCIFPTSIVVRALLGTSYSWLLLINLAAARHIRNIKPFLDHFASLKPMTYRLVPVFLMLPLLVHNIACGWIYLGSGNSEPTDSMTTYIRAMYWAFTTLTTVGYGDIVARTNVQMLFTCAVQIVGVGVFGFVLSSVAGIIARSDAAREHHMDNLDKIETFMSMHSPPKELRSKIRNYYHYMWMNKKGYNDDALLDDLPSKIQSELIFHINKKIIEKAPFFKGASHEFVNELMAELQSRVYVPGEKIFRVDEKGDALYLVQSGSVEIVGRNNETIATLHEGTIFGEMAMLLNQPRNATAVANTFCDIYVLKREAFDRVVEFHPDFAKHLKDVVAARTAA